MNSKEIRCERIPTLLFRFRVSFLRLLLVSHLLRSSSSPISTLASAAQCGYMIWVAAT